MFGSFLPLLDRFPLGRWCCLALLAACLGISGCTHVNLRGDGFADNELSNIAREMRQADESGPSHAVSNRARQIDRSLGGSRPVSPSDSPFLAP
jgi:hypothetical protein